MTHLERQLRLLVQARVNFIVIGGMAAAAHGSARSTLDLDVVYSRDRENVKRLAGALASHAPYLRGAPPGLPFVFDEPTILHGLNFTLTSPTSAISTFLVRWSAAGRTRSFCLRQDRDRCIRHAVPLRHPGRAHSPEAGRGRPEDLEAIAELELIRAGRKAEACAHFAGHAKRTA